MEEEGIIPTTSRHPAARTAKMGKDRGGCATSLPLDRELHLLSERESDNCTIWGGQGSAQEKEAQGIESWSTRGWKFMKATA